MKLYMVIVALMLITQVGAAKADSMVGPESFLYPLKIWMEKFSLNFVFNHTERTQRMFDMAEERLKEAEISPSNSKAFENAMRAYVDQLEELMVAIEKDTDNMTRNTEMDIMRKMQEQKNRTEVLTNTEEIKIIQQNIIKAISSSSENRIEVTVVGGNVSINTEGSNATVMKEGNNVTITSSTNNSRQMIIVRSSNNTSSSSSTIIVKSVSNVSF